MTGPAYPPARMVAARVQPHFARHLDAARKKGEENLAPDVAVGAIEAVINAAFWASLRREEGYLPKISIAMVPREQAHQPLLFERSLPLSPYALSKLAPAVERPGIHLGVWHQGGELRVWGTVRTVPEFCFVLEVVAPGLLVIKHSRGDDYGKFVNVAVLEGDQVKVLDQHAASLPDCPNLVTSLLGFDSTLNEGDSINVLVQLAVSMRSHGRGGSLLVVPGNSTTWRESIMHPILYSVSPAYSELAELMREEPGEEHEQPWHEALRRAVDAIAGLTAVDGATIITDDYELLAFGAKIRRRDQHPSVERIVVTEPIECVAGMYVSPSEIGGTRHVSAAQFCQDQRDALALVASQDGRFTIFAWSSCEAMVHAHRAEALLL